MPTPLKWCLYLTSIMLLTERSASAQALPDSARVIILQKDEPLTGKVQPLGVVKVTDRGFKTNCGYERTMDEAREKARAIGGNLLKITMLKPPDAWSTCYRLHADVFYVADIDGFYAQKKAAAEAQIKTMLADTASCSLLCIYRPESMLSATATFNILANDSLVCRVKNGGKYFVRLYSSGKTTVQMRTEVVATVTIDAKPGQVYFLRCGGLVGIIKARGRLELATTDEGLAEFGSIPDKNTGL